MTKSLKKIALIVTLGTAFSKLGGLLRQLIIAGAFGIGAAYNAYNYAYIVPGFFLVLLGGINGPLHNAMVSVLSRKSHKEGRYITSAINTSVSSFLLLVSAVLFIASDPLIKIVGPGLTEEVHQIAVTQLQIMSPVAFLAGLIGIGFGSLNTRDEFFIPSIAPILSSFCLIIGVSIFWFQESQSINFGLSGGGVLAIATLIGALFQWIIQIPSLIRKGLWKIKFVWDLKHSGVKEVFKIIFPASLSSGMLHINVFTDLFFASGITGAAAGLSYANFVIQAPLGLISNAILIPLLPTLSKLANSEKKNELLTKIREGLIFSTASMIGLAAILIPLSTPVIKLIFERGAFDENAVFLVSGLLIAYGFGMPAYLGRDLLVRVFYALGDAQTPFKLSAIAIWLNIILDWVLIGGPSPWGNQLPFNFGAIGIVLATVIINFATCVKLLFELNSKLGKLPIKDWSGDLIKLFISGAFAGIIAFIANTIIKWPESFIGLLIEVIISSSLSLLAFGITTNFLKIQEINQMTKLLRRKIIRL